MWFDPICVNYIYLFTYLKTSEDTQQAWWLSLGKLGVEEM